MSILIRDMAMPKNCAYCPCEHYECALMGDEHNGVDVTAYFEGDKRHPDCPLIEVKPHGDLIDKRMLINDITNNAFANADVDSKEEYEFWNRVWEYIRKIPIVVESEDG